MTVAITADATDFLRLGRVLDRLPMDIKAKAFARTMRRTGDMAKTRIIKRSAERVKIPQKMVRERSRRFNSYDSYSFQMDLTSAWVSLSEIGARQTAKGVSVKLRGSYRSAFIAKMKTGHVGVFERDGKERLHISELFGPNPAHDAQRNPKPFIDILEYVMDNTFLPRFIHELSRLMPAA